MTIEDSEASEKILDLSKLSQKLVEEQIIVEGEILRFKPGIQKDFVPRWVQLTNKCFRYFENKNKVMRDSALSSY